MSSHPLGGLFTKFHIERADDSHHLGRKHQGCFTFALDLSCDPLAAYPLKVYADLLEECGYVELATGLRWVLEAHGYDFTTAREEGP
jgi:hypothetical protein